jgi:hypothetical protein
VLRAHAFFQTTPNRHFFTIPSQSSHGTFGDRG